MGAITSTFRWIINRYRVRLLMRAVGRLSEISKYSLVRPRSARVFHIVSGVRNAETAAVRCLQSVYDQHYPRNKVRHVFIDDNSTDPTAAAIREWLEVHPWNSVEFTENPSRIGAFANNLEGFRQAQPDEIVLELNGDDWLPDNGVLSFLNKVYADPDVWTTFNTFVRADGIFHIALGPSRKTIASGRLRRGRWATSALHTFRSELFHHIDPSAFVDPSTNELWESAHDIATYLPMIELAGDHARHLYRTTYFYNLRSSSDEITDRSGQLKAAAGIRALPRHRPLASLHRNPPQDPNS